MYKLSQKQKLICDYGLAALGTFIGNLVSGGVIGTVAGAIAGFAISDLAFYVDNGTIPVAQVEQQAVQALDSAHSS
ncbi:MAG: hypothetical protein ACYCQJ_02620 [Nitrososphaerales archaeon]